MTKKQKKVLIRIIISAFLMIGLEFIPVHGLTRFFLYLIPYLIIGYDILHKAVKGIINRQIFDENFLMSVATIGAILIGIAGSGDYIEAIAVMLFYQIGELFQSYAVGKSRKNISNLMDIRPDYVNIEDNSKYIQVDPDEIEIGTQIVVLPGEKIPIDGVIEDGTSSINAVALTGESFPRRVSEGDEVLSGCINMSGMLKIRTTKEFGESTVSKILELVENASSRKSKSENFISRFARIYTPVVCYSALGLAILPPIINVLTFDTPANWGTWVYRALTFLVASCPCAVVISVPLGFFAGIGRAGKEGILIKGSNYLEALSQTSSVVFDKTGTLTKGVFEVCEVYSSNLSEDALIEFAVLAESSSTHPIARSLQNFYGKEPDITRVSNMQEISGCGITAKIDDHFVAVGNDKLMKQFNVNYTDIDKNGTVIYIAIDNIYSGYVVIADTIKPTSRKAIMTLENMGITNTVMLTGDTKSVACMVGDKLGIKKIYSDLLPGDKVSKVEELLSSKSKKGKLAFVGDGINDAPVLSRADIGIAMGALGSDAAIEAADVVLMDDDPLKIATAMKISKKCLGIVYQNIIFSIAVKLASLILVALGAANMWLAIFADVGVMVLAVLNAIRVLFIK